MPSTTGAGALASGRWRGAGVQAHAAGLVAARVVEVPGDLDGPRPHRDDVDPPRQRQLDVRQRDPAAQVHVGLGDALQRLHRA
jgi:hypothetical protein